MPSNSRRASARSNPASAASSTGVPSSRSSWNRPRALLFVVTLEVRVRLVARRATAWTMAANLAKPRGLVYARAALRWAWLLFVCAGCDTADERPATWSYVHAAIIAPSCATASCHNKVSSAAGLDFSTRTSAYAFLVGRTCDAPDPPGEAVGNFVFPYDPDRSTLLYLLRGDQRNVMPPDQPLPEVEVELVERWVLEGAQCD